MVTSCSWRHRRAARRRCSWQAGRLDGGRPYSQSHQRSGQRGPLDRRRRRDPQSHTAAECVTAHAAVRY